MGKKTKKTQLYMWEKNNEKNPFVHGKNVTIKNPIWHGKKIRVEVECLPVPVLTWFLNLKIENNTQLDCVQNLILIFTI